jgi:D-beta-D-heptose 7-phosphate kinase/D-beta-D-heptose 1-phosphate adenosyltransferase
MSGIDHEELTTKRLVTYEQAGERVRAYRVLGHKIVMTSGSFDLLHIGHARYFREAKNIFGDSANTVLIVGVDGDDKVRARKGPDRPVIPEVERAEMCLHTRYVDYAVIKPVEAERWELIRIVRPDVLVVSERNPVPDEDIEGLRRICGEVRILESMASTSTSANVRRLVIGFKQEVEERLKAVIDFLEEKAGGGR